MIELQVELDGAFRPLKPSPIKHRGTKLNNRGVEGSQGMCEPEPPPFGCCDRLTTGEDLIEEGLVELPGPMRIGIGQRGASRRPSDAKVDQFAQGRGQTTTDFAQRVRTPHLTEQHRHKVLPASKSLGRSFRGMLPNSTREVRTIDESEDLRKATGDGYHTAPPACGWHGAETPWMDVRWTIHPTHKQEAF
jgi:hypothetical protein